MTGARLTIIFSWRAVQSPSPIGRRRRWVSWILLGPTARTAIRYSRASSRHDSRYDGACRQSDLGVGRRRLVRHPLSAWSPGAADAETAPRRRPPRDRADGGLRDRPGASS